MRQVVLDTETTGLTVDDGHRIIEIGCLEVVNRRITGNTLHFYVNPDRAIDEGAQAVHGISLESLQDKPRFADVAREILSFVGQAEVIIHNAPFDTGFLDAELARVGERPFREHCRVLDTLALARELHPGKRNSLDALCDRYGISNAHRKLHGALLDAELLADVYLAMTRGQESLEIALHARPDPGQSQEGQRPWPPAGLVVIEASEAEQAAHVVLLAAIAKEAKGPALWQRLEPPV
ncbi:MAG TPA: DNA polymerase III subunit epsilon [Burkholderiaceae bacterium]|nr:DNA polymerase III subunit epsilon [Burkholderiaceae bacterium]